MSHWIRTLINDLELERRKYPEHMISGLDRAASFIESQYEYVFRLAALEEIYDEILLSEDMEDLASLLMRTAEITGFEHVTIHIIDPGDETNFKTYLCTSYPKKWVMRYREKSYKYVDPVAVRASLGDGVFHFSALNNTSPLAKDFWRDAVAHGIGENGYSIVASRVNSVRVHACFSTRSSEIETSESIRINGSDLNHLTDCAIDTFLALTSGRQYNGNELSYEELNYLRDLAYRGENSGSQRTMDELELLNKNIVKKLGVDTMFQAVAIAGTKRWLTAIDSSNDETYWISGSRNQVMKGPKIIAAEKSVDDS